MSCSSARHYSRRPEGYFRAPPRHWPPAACNHGTRQSVLTGNLYPLAVLKLTTFGLDTHLDLPGTTLYTSGQVLREYLSIATVPATQKGLGLARRDAAANVRALRGRLRFAAEHERVHERLLELLDAVQCLGKQVHDANIIATMLAHGIDTLVTINVADFNRFADRVRLVDLATT